MKDRILNALTSWIDNPFYQKHKLTLLVILSAIAAMLIFPSYMSIAVLIVQVIIYGIVLMDLHSDAKRTSALHYNTTYKDKFVKFVKFNRYYPFIPYAMAVRYGGEMIKNLIKDYQDFND